MGRFTGNPLRLIDRLYKFIGAASGVSELDTEAPIIRVHDLSREAELGTLATTPDVSTASENPYFTINVDEVIGGAGTSRSAFGIYSNQSPSWSLATWVAPDPTEETVWILGAGVNIDTAGAVSAVHMLHDFAPKAGAGAGQSPDLFVEIFNAELAPNSLGEMSMVGTLPGGQSYPFPVLNKLLNNSPIEFVIVSSAAVAVDLFVRCLRLPIGVQPPGMR